MFGRTLNVLVNGVALATAAVITLMVGTACKGPDSSGPPEYDDYTGVARGANVIPTPAPADTSARAFANVTTNTTTNTISYTYAITTPPGGTLDSIALYQVDAGVALAASATAVLCAGAAACAATSGTATIIAPATATTIKTSMRGYGTQLVFFTTTAQKAAGGAMRGTMYVLPTQ